MSKFMVNCPHCNGTGKIPHSCKPGDCRPIQILSESGGQHYSTYHESLIIRKCEVCGQLWKVRHQWDSGTGNDDIWLRPGESQRRYEFTHEEATKYMDKSGSDAHQPTLFSKEEIEKCL